MEHKYVNASKCEQMLDPLAHTHTHAFDLNVGEPFARVVKVAPKFRYVAFVAFSFSVLLFAVFFFVFAVAAFVRRCCWWFLIAVFFYILNGLDRSSK